MTATTPASDVAAFVTARLQEDEAAAREAMADSSGEWASWNRSWDSEPQRDLAIDGARRAVLPTWMDEHVCRHDPARVLAQVAALRQIVEAHAGRLSRSTADWYGDDDPPADMMGCAECGSFGEYTVAWPCPTLRALASIWADHDEYRAEWSA